MPKGSFLKPSGRRNRRLLGSLTTFRCQFPSMSVRRGFMAPLTLFLVLAHTGSVELAKMPYSKTTNQPAPSTWKPVFGMRISKSTAGFVNCSPA